MKVFIPIFLASCIAALAQDPPREFDKLETTNGRVYERVKVSKIEPDGISIVHEAGTAKIQFERLPQELRDAFGFDAGKAESHRKEKAETQAKADAVEAKISSERVSKLAESAKIEASAEFRKKVNSIAKKVKVSGFQNSEIGIIGTITVMKSQVRPVRGSMVKKDIVWVFASRSDGVIRGVKGAKVQETMDATGAHLGIAPSFDTEISWDGKAWPIGTVQYTTSHGLLRTCPLFTANEDDAVSFYKQHGFTKQAENAVWRPDKK